MNVLKSKFLLTLVVLVSLQVTAQKANSLKPLSWNTTEVQEPSDICINPLKENSFFMVSDNGYVYETDLQGKIIRTADFKGLDIEAIYAVDDMVYVVEEFTRKIRVFDNKTLTLQRTVHHPYTGGRNKGYEAFVFNEANQKFLLFTEKDPIYLFELDKDLKIVNEISYSHIARDLSAATFHNDHLWLLSDEDRTVFKVHPLTYEVLNKWIIPVVNPEGICFDAKGNLLILSDDMQRIYQFPNPETQP